jgi:hypothetical protein
MHRQWICSGQKLKPQRNTKVHKAYVIQEEALTTEDTGDTEAASLAFSLFGFGLGRGFGRFLLWGKLLRN